MLLWRVSVFEVGLECLPFVAEGVWGSYSVLSDGSLSCCSLCVCRLDRVPRGLPRSSQSSAVFLLYLPREYILFRLPLPTVTPPSQISKHVQGKVSPRGIQKKKEKKKDEDNRSQTASEERFHFHHKPYLPGKDVVYIRHLFNGHGAVRGFRFPTG